MVRSGGYGGVEGHQVQYCAYADLCTLHNDNPGNDRFPRNRCIRTSVIYPCLCLIYQVSVASENRLHLKIQIDR